MTHEQFKTEILPLHKAMYRMAYAATRSQEDAADIVQDTFVKLWQHRDTLSSVDNPQAYCITALRHQCVTYLRTRRDTTSLDTAGALDPARMHSTAEPLEHRDTLELLSRIIDTLPERQRQIISLSTFSGFSNEEIAEATGLTDVNVRAILSRTRRRIKELFSKNQ